MIILLVGGIGSGKSLSAIKEMVTRRQTTYTNFQVYNYPVQRLKRSDLFVMEEGKDKEKPKMKLNFQYWQEQTKKGGFDIYLDEFHNLMSARRSMSKKNVLFSDWLSQIRKILGATETNNLYLITQKLRRIDVNSRDLAHYCILCRKQQFKDVLLPTPVMEEGKLVTKKLPLTIIYKYHFNSPEMLQTFEDFGMKTYLYISRFIANPYFRHYNSYELIDFGSEEYI